MRLANLALRDVKLQCLHTPSPRAAPRVLRLDLQSVARHSLHLSQPSSTAITTHDEHRDETFVEVHTRPASRVKNFSDPLILVHPKSDFGNWTWLAHDPKRLALETDFNHNLRRREREPLLVDTLEHHGDFALWLCLLDHLQRLQGDAGTERLWLALWDRRSLHHDGGASAVPFWTTIIGAAVRSPDVKFLQSVWAYAEWMREVHDVEMPRLYITVVEHFLRTRQHLKALQWHLWLSHSFHPGSAAFSSLIEQFVTDPDLNSSNILQDIYIASPERQLYDTLIPKLYANGQGNLARLWRIILLRHNDAPKLHTPNKPFLRYFQGYWNRDISQLDPQEVEAITSTASQEEDDGQVQQVEMSSEFLNRVLGKTFGLSAKGYDDRLGARWLATRWVSLDMAMSMVAALGVREIGPVSLQSIALRAGGPQAVLDKIALLGELDIALPKIVYTDIIKKFAQSGDAELLSDLLECDIHPDVFEDVPLQSKLMESSAASGLWRTHRLLVAARLATAEKSTRRAANALLREFLQVGNLSGFQQVLLDMRVHRVNLYAHHGLTFFKILMQDVRSYPEVNDPPRHLDIYISICRTLSDMDVPVPAMCWRRILLCLGHQGRLDDVLTLSHHLVEYYTTRQSSRPGFVPVHIWDLPPLIARPLSRVEQLMGLFIPLDTPLEQQMHPLALIFDQKLLRSTVLWSFRKLSDTPTVLSWIDTPLHLLNMSNPVVRVIKMFRALVDSGYRTDRLESQLRKWVSEQLVELYGEVESLSKQRAAAQLNYASSPEEMVDLCETAWGSPFLRDDGDFSLAKKFSKRSQRSRKRTDPGSSGLRSS